MTAEVDASKKFACPACGAEAQWKPAQQALVCPYCSTVSPAELSADGQTIKENDLATAMRNLGSDQRGWQAAKTSVRCQSCQAISVFDEKTVAQRCDFCGSPALIPQESRSTPIKPESLLPIKVTESEVRESIRRWYRTRWFAPNKLKARAFTDTVRGAYLPYWTFDAQVSAHWTAQSGYYYYENETYRDSEGKTKTRRVRRTRWRPSSGHLEHFFDDELVPATKGVDPKLLRRVEPFPTKELIAYEPGYLSGWVVEQYQIDLIAAAAKSQAAMNTKVRAMCARDVPGDTHRNLNVDARYSQQTFKHILAPVWLLTYRFGRKSFQVVVNGYTGRIAGQHPLSVMKIVLLVIAILLLGLGVYFGVQHFG